MDTVNVPQDRHLAHVFLAQMYTEQYAPRNFQWRMFFQNGVASAIVRKHDEIINLPEIGENVKFEIEAIAMTQRRGKRRYLLTPQERIPFIVGSLWSNAGLLADPNNICVVDAPTYINKNSSRFAKPAAIFNGSATIFDKDKLKHVMQNGMGQGKAYGYGLLLINQAQ